MKPFKKEYISEFKSWSLEFQGLLREQISAQQRQDRIKLVKKVFKFLRETESIWALLEKIRCEIRRKVFKLMKHPELREEMIDFAIKYGWNYCQGKTLNGDQCSRHVRPKKGEGFFCHLHNPESAWYYTNYYPKDELKKQIDINIKAYNDGVFASRDIAEAVARAQVVERYNQSRKDTKELVEQFSTIDDDDDDDWFEDLDIPDLGIVE